MSRDEILLRLKEILRAEFEIPSQQVVPEASLAEDLDLDSVDAVALLIRLEEETGLAVSEDELRSLRTVEQVIDLVHAHLQPRSA